MNNIIAIPAFQDNYIWLIPQRENENGHDNTSVIIIDPGESQPVLEHLRNHQQTPSAIFITHQCHDHVDGIKAILSRYPVPVYGPATEMIPGMTHPLKQDDRITLHSAQFQVIDVPGHTDGHIAYYHPGRPGVSGRPGALFCGDTLFAAGSGRLHTGLYDEMFRSLQKISALPDDTLIYCAHEYTLANLKFARHLEPDNLDIQTRMKQTQVKRQQNQITVPSSLIEEKQSNPFLRCHTDVITEAARRYADKTGLPTPINAAAVFRLIRRWKDGF